MSRLFAVPCPECGGWLATEDTGDLRCPGCVRAYHVILGVLVPIESQRNAPAPRSPTGEPRLGAARARKSAADAAHRH